MHDGYLFTLGICGTASAASPALALLNTLLAALPPVKRAAMLGEVLPLDEAGRPHDPLRASVVADIADAELLLVVTPLLAGAKLPPRLEDLFRSAASPRPAPEPGGKIALLVGLAPIDELAARVEALRALNHLAAHCRRAGVTPIAPLLLRDSRAEALAILDEEALAAVRSAYEQASATLRCQGIEHLR